jgi:hypothetical protein
LSLFFSLSRVSGSLPDISLHRLYIGQTSWANDMAASVPALWSEIHCRSRECTRSDEWTCDGGAYGADVGEAHHGCECGGQWSMVRGWWLMVGGWCPAVIRQLQPHPPDGCNHYAKCSSHATLVMCPPRVAYVDPPPRKRSGRMVPRNVARNVMMGSRPPGYVRALVLFKRLDRPL